MRWPWLAIPGALALWLLLGLVGAQARVDRSIGDLLVRSTAPQSKVGESVIVDIDDASLQALREPLGEWPYSRDVYGLLLNYLAQARVRLVVLDIVFAGPREGDRRFAEAIASGPPTVLAAAGLAQRQRAAEELAPITRAEQQALQRLGVAGPAGLPWDGVTLPPSELLASLKSRGSLGLISVSLDGDGLLRHQPLLHGVEGQSLPSLALAARLRADRLVDWHLEGDELVAGRHRWPVDDLGRIRMRLPPDAGSPLHLSWQRVMRAALGETDDAELMQHLAGRAVFVGSSAFFADEVMTPMGRLNGTTLNAALFDALGAEPVPVLHERGAAVWVLNVLLLALGMLPLLMLRHQVLAAGLSLLGLGSITLAAAASGYLTTPAPAIYVLVLAMLLIAIEHERQARQRERELTRERELADARSRAKTDLLAQVSHEMRTPMNAVLGFSDILARSPLKPEQEHYVELLGHAGRQVFNLINDLLDNARIESGRMELAEHPFNLVDLVELQVELLRTRATAQHLWLRVFVRSQDTGWVLGDAKRVAQIVTNLVGNAIKFTQAGGVIVEIARDPNGLMVLAVQDTGIGIAHDRLERIFQPFEQADASVEQQFGGTGLGLAITRSLARLMGGDVSVQSEPGNGSRFEARLDLPATEPPRDEVEASMARTTPSRSVKLLLAEDNDVNVLIIEGMLVPLGHKVTRVRDGLQALEALGQEDFDLVLMDMQMPNMDGLTATRRWRSTEAAEGSSRMPIVALTANAYDTDVEQSLAAGCDAHLTKPISLPALLQALGKYAKR